jgi:hypothetical protein
MQARVETTASDTLSQDSRRPAIEMFKTPSLLNPYVVAPDPPTQFGDIDAPSR